MERQEKYVRDGVIGCWLVEIVPSKLSEERPDFPLFYVAEQDDKSFSLSLSGRKELQLRDFLRNFLIGKIKFCDLARTASEQKVTLEADAFETLNNLPKPISKPGFASVPVTPHT